MTKHETPIRMVLTGEIEDMENMRISPRLVLDDVAIAMLEENRRSFALGAKRVKPKRR